MSDTASSIIGTVAPSRQARADFPFYEGPVGVRERDGWLDVAFFAPLVRMTLPISGLLDGKRVRITAVSTRQIDPAAKARGAMHAITATVILEEGA